MRTRKFPSRVGRVSDAFFSRSENGEGVGSDICMPKTQIRWQRYFSYNAVDEACKDVSFSFLYCLF